MKRLSLVFIGLFALTLFAMADGTVTDQPVYTDNPQGSMMSTNANPAPATTAADIGAPMYMNDNGTFTPIMGSEPINDNTDHVDATN
jgi:hypothetical protein